MIDFYLHAVKTHPLISSAIQVGLLGMFGELLAIKIRTGKWYFFGPGPQRLLLKIFVWSFLGITFKYAFMGFHGFVDALVIKNLWMDNALHSGFVRAASVSVFTNLLFGPVMMLFHRITDNLIENKTMDWPSLQKAWVTLFWFWIPAHTITFMLPSYFQVGLAAIWAIALGIILGLSAKR